MSAIYYSLFDYLNPAKELFQVYRLSIAIKIVNDIGKTIVQKWQPFWLFNVFYPIGYVQMGFVNGWPIILLC